MSQQFEGPEHRLAQAKVELLTAVILYGSGPAVPQAGQRVIEALARHEGALEVVVRHNELSDLREHRDAIVRECSALPDDSKLRAVVEELLPWVF